MTTTVRRENSEWKTQGEGRQMDSKQADEDRWIDKQKSENKQLKTDEGKQNDQQIVDKQKMDYR